MTLTLDLSAVPDAALPAMRQICKDSRDKARLLFDALLSAVIAEGRRRNDGGVGCVELDLTVATVADVSEALTAAIACAFVVTNQAHREPNDVIASGWIAIALVFLDIRAQLLATADIDALRAFRSQTFTPPTAA
jgi:hypothetical protein